MRSVGLERVDVGYSRLLLLPRAQELASAAEAACPGQPLISAQKTGMLHGCIYMVQGSGLGARYVCPTAGRVTLQSCILPGCVPLTEPGKDLGLAGAVLLVAVAPAGNLASHRRPVASQPDVLTHPDNGLLASLKLSTGARGG